MRLPPLAAGVAVLACVLGVQAVAAVRDVATLPGIAQWASVIQSSPAERRLHEQRLLDWVRQGNDPRALAYLDALSEKQPAVAAALHETLAGVYVHDRRLFRATQHLDAIPADLTTDQSRYLGAVIAARQQRLEDAGRAFDELARRLPDDPVIARDQAQIASLLGRHAVAAAATERLLKLQPGNGWATLVLARARMQQGRAQDAERLLEGLLAREPRNGQAALTLGLLQLARGSVQEARTSFARARVIGAGDATPYVAEAAAALLLGERAAARAASAGAWKQNPADPLAGLSAVLAHEGALPPPIRGSARSVAASLYPDLETEPLAAVVGTELASTGQAAEVATASLLAKAWSPRAALDWLAARPAEGAAGPLRQLTAIRAALEAGDLRRAGDGIAALERGSGRGLVGPAVQAAALAARRNDAAGARAAMDRAAALAPGSARIAALAGDLELALGEPAKAVPFFRAALEGWPRDPRLLNQLAASLALVGSRRDWEEALSLAEAGLRQQPHYLLRANLLDTRADLLHRLGRTGEAYAAYRELSTTVGGMTTPEQWHRLGELAMAARNSALARKAFEEALDYGREYPGRDRAVAGLDSLSSSPAPE